MKKPRVLCIDIEGGHGGSSRSLYQTLAHMGSSQVDLDVITRKGGWIEQAYRNLGVGCRVEPDMPRWTNLERLTRNLATETQFWLRDWPKSSAFRKRLISALDDVDLLHLNHISLSHLAVWIRKVRPDLPIVMHIRTMPVLTVFAVRQSRMAASACNGFVFITENERDHFESLLGSEVVGRVIFNPSEIPTTPPARHEAVPNDGRLKIACLSNFSHTRGVGRLVEIAKALSPAERERIEFVVAGDMKLPRERPPHVAAWANDARSLVDIVRARGLETSFRFLGHVRDPERVLAACDVLVKPTRENNPWGRDILEAMAAAIPVFSVGTYARFVETDVTGLLQSRFDSTAAARFLVHLADDPAYRKALGSAAQNRVADLNDPGRQANALRTFWTETIQSASATPKRRIRVGAVMPAYTAGGSERVLTTLIGGLAQQDFQTRLFVLSNDGDLSVDLHGIGFVHNLGIGRLRHAALALWRMLSGFHCEVVFASQVHLNICLLSIGRLLPGAKIVIREANMPSACLAGGHWPAWYRPLYRWALKGAAGIIASSETMRDEFVSLLGARPNLISVIYNPVDEAGLRQSAAQTRRETGNGRRFVAVGRLVRQKGFDRLIKWMAAMPAADRLDLFGDGPDGPALAEQIRATGMTDRITLRGFVPSPAAAIAGADALLMPSRWEGMPNAALEALAVGTPVIATAESGAISEIAAQAHPGAVTVAQDEPAFVAAMSKVVPVPRSSPSPSLLPACFNKSSVIRAFAELIQKVHAA